MNESVKLPRFILLDGMRGVAAFSIVLFHLYFYQFRFFNGIAILVDFFFVLSGFVLAPTLFSREKGIRKRFLRARCIRLWPTVFVSFILIISSHFIPYIEKYSSAPKFSFIDYVLSFLLLQVLIPGIYKINIPLWSLSAELLVNIFSSVLSIRRSTLFVMVFLGVVLQILGFQNGSSFLQFPHLGIKPELWWIGRALEGFYLGLLLSHSRNERSLLEVRDQCFSLKRLTIAIFCVLASYCSVLTSNKLIFLAAPTFYFLIKEILLIDQNFIPIPLRKVCIFFGKISYGIYVFHEPVSQILSGKFLAHYLHLDLHSPITLVLGAMLKILATLIITLVSLSLIESPLRRWAGQRFLNNVD